jgi:hypothetical protein
MSRHPFQKLRGGMTPEQRASANAQVQEMTVEMLLAEMRKLMGPPQEEQASAMGIMLPSLSGPEDQDDMPTGTLRRLIEALGGEMEIIAHLPHADVCIRRFKDVS